MRGTHVSSCNVGNFSLKIVFKFYNFSTRRWSWQKLLLTIGGGAIVFFITLGAGLTLFCISAGMFSSKVGFSVPSVSPLYRFKTAAVVSTSDGNVCAEIGR